MEESMKYLIDASFPFFLASLLLCHKRVFRHQHATLCTIFPPLQKPREQKESSHDVEE